MRSTASTQLFDGSHLKKNFHPAGPHEAVSQTNFTIRSSKSFSKVLRLYQPSSHSLIPPAGGQPIVRSSNDSADHATIQTETKRLRSAISPKPGLTGISVGNQVAPNLDFHRRLGSIQAPSRIFTELTSYKGFYLTPASMKPPDTHYKLVVRTVTKKGLDDNKVTSHPKVKQYRSPSGQIGQSLMSTQKQFMSDHKLSSDIMAHYDKPLTRSLSPYLDLKDLQISAKINGRRLLDGITIPKPITIEKSISNVKELSLARKEPSQVRPAEIHNDPTPEYKKPMSRIQKKKNEKGLTLSIFKQEPTELQLIPNEPDTTVTKPPKAKRAVVTFDTANLQASHDEHSPRGAFKQLFQGKKTSSPKDKADRRFKQKVVFRKSFEDLYYSLKLLGKNENFQVWEAIDKRTCKLVVVKAYETSRFLGRFDVKKRVEESIRVHSSVFHPNIARLKCVKQISNRVITEPNIASVGDGELWAVYFGESHCCLREKKILSD